MKPSEKRFLKDFLKEAFILLVAVCTVIWFVWHVAPAEAGQGILVGQWVEGQSRFCKYNDGGRIYIVTIHSSSPCPMSD